MVLRKVIVLRFRLEDVYLPKEICTVHGGQVNPLYKSPKGRKIIGKIEKKERK